MVKPISDESVYYKNRSIIAAKRPDEITARFQRQKVALEALKGEKTLSELAQQFEFTRIRSCSGKRASGKKVNELFEKENTKNDGPDIVELHAKIGELTGERFYRNCAQSHGAAERKQMN
ncbi:hypothetical protein MASR1M12_12940 [Erysipelotrichia bacterium]